MTASAKVATNKRQVTATIAVSSTQSSEINLQGDSLIGIFVPANLTGTVLTLQAAAAQGGTFLGVIDSTGAAISITVAAGKYLSLTQDQVTRFLGIQNLKITSGTTQATTAANLILVTRPIK